MRYLWTLIGFFLTLELWSQACMLPHSINAMKPEKCGIRYVESQGDKIHVILEFEKKARIITPENPKDVKGKAYNLQGIYNLEYDQEGHLISESRSFLQTGDVPEKGLIFGLNGQRGDLIEYDIRFISQEAFDSIPWVAFNAPAKAPVPTFEADTFYQTELNIDKHYRITDLGITRYWQSNEDDQLDSFALQQNLELYDSSDQKRYWTSVYFPFTDPVRGHTLAMLNLYDRKTDKEISERHWRLTAFDAMGRDSNHFQWDFEFPAEVAYRNEKLSYPGSKHSPLDKQVWVFTQKNLPAETTYRKYFYHEFDAGANLLNKSEIVTNHNPFDEVHHLWLDQGVLYISQVGAEVRICHIDNLGANKISTTGNRLEDLRKLSQGGRMERINLTLANEPKIFTDSTILMIYHVRENVGVSASAVYGQGSESTTVHHGLVVLHIEAEGDILAAKFYQRPKNADPRTPVTMGPIERNDEGQISFYAFETTSIGTYPVLYTIRQGNVSILKNDRGATASRYIYFDANEGIVSYFGLIKDPDDPRNAVRTVEVLRDED